MWFKLFYNIPIVILIAEVRLKVSNVLKSKVVIQDKYLNCVHMLQYVTTKKHCCQIHVGKNHPLFFDEFRLKFPIRKIKSLKFCLALLPYTVSK